MRLARSLQSALNLRFIAAATLPLLIFGWFTYRYMVERQLDVARNALHGHALNLTEEVGEFFTEVQADLVLLRGMIVQLRAVAPDEIDPLLQTFTAQSESFEAIYLLDDQLKIRHLGLPPNLLAQRQDYQGLDLSRIEFLTHRSLPQAATGGTTLPDVVWSDTFVSMVTGKPSVMIKLKLSGGFLLGTVNLDRLATYLHNRVPDAEEITFAVIDHHGTLIAHTDQKLAVERRNFLDHPEVQAALASSSELPAKFFEDENRLDSVFRVRQTGWVVHASMPREFILRDANRLRIVLISTMIIAAVLGGGLAFWQAQQLVRPLLALRDSTQGVARGDYRGLGQLEGDSYVELNDLSANFLEMGAAVMERETYLRASEARYSSLLAGMGEGLLIIDRNGKVTDCNEIAERIFSLPRKEIVGQQNLPDHWRIIHEDGSPVFPDEYPYNVTLRTGADVNNQLLGLCLPDGQEIWLQMNSRPQWSLHGNVNAAVVTFADVTRLKVAEASLRVGKLRYQELSQQFSALLEGITDRIYLLTPDMQVVWSNSKPADGGESESEKTEEGCCFTRHFRRDEPCPGCPVLRCFASGRRETGEIVDRQGLTWSLRAFPVKNENVVTQVVLISEDITEMLEGERQRERASRLAALGELAAGVAHEINNPISGVINYAQLIANRAEENSREHDLAKRIIKEGDRIATIVRELLTFAREGNSDLQVISIREALAEALSLCESQIRKEAIDLHVDLPNDLPKVESRNNQLQQLFLNLISNARHALSEKYPEPHADKILLVTGRRAELNGRSAVRLIVRDHGIGIPPELLERVMNPFVTTKPAGIGTGLGLSISFEIAKKHGGSLSIASEHGVWTEVIVDLPAHMAAANG
jgi:PAS domain S-box-containing protein